MKMTQTEIWQDLVKQAADYSGVQLDEELESYLVFLLMRHLKDADLATRTMALKYLTGMQSQGDHRLEQMRDVADQCLLTSGLFPERAQRRQVTVSYYVKLGRSAYLNLSELTQNAIASMYMHLAESFISLMDTLQAMRCIGNPSLELARLEPLKAYEQWQNQTQRHACRQFTDGFPVNIEQIGINSKIKH